VSNPDFCSTLSLNKEKQMRHLRTLFVLAAALIFAGVPSFAQYAPYAGSNLSRVGGRFIAVNYNYSGNQTYVLNGNSATGSATITIQAAKIVLPDGRVIFPFNLTSPIIVGAGSTQELVTPTAVSNCQNLSTPGYGTCSITATFAATHGQGESVISGTGGLAEAIYDAYLAGGGAVSVDAAWASGVFTGCTACFGSANAAIAGIVVYPSVEVEDTRFGNLQFWTPVSNATFIAVPATLTATTVGFGLNGANTTGGTYTGASTYHYCVSYVDVMGNEGPCSLDFSAATAGTGSTNQIGFAAPAASTGAVGWVPYISLAGGTYALSYRVPLTASVCTLTKLETTIAACAVANSTYGQSGSTAQVSALTVNTARIAAQLGAASTTSDIVSNSGAHTVYIYAPGTNSPGALPISSYAPFTITTAAATTVPAILGTVQLPAGFMNFVGKTIRICGKATQAAAGSTATITTIQMIWDADGSNTTGAGVIIGSGEVLTSTLVTGNADAYNFCETLRTTVSGASATAGSIQSTSGWLVVEGAQTSTSNRAGANISVGTTGSLNLAGEARIDVQYVHTTGTDAAGVILQNLTVEVLN
jgi:hypothetical protein